MKHAKIANRDKHLRMNILTLCRGNKGRLFSKQQLMRWYGEVDGDSHIVGRVIDLLAEENDILKLLYGGRVLITLHPNYVSKSSLQNRKL